VTATLAHAGGSAGELSRSTIKLVFLIQAVASGSFFTRIPDLQLGLGLDAATLGLAFLGQPVGAIAMFLLASRIIEGVGTRVVLLAGLPLMALALVLMTLVPSAFGLFAAIAAYAAVFALTNVAMNVEADRVEAATGRRIMNTCHGIWSLGQLAVFVAGVFARGLDISPLVHFAAMLPLVAVAVLVVVLPMREAPARDHAQAVRRRFALPTAATLRLLGFMVGGAMVEAATRTWSVIYSRDSFDAPGWADALTLPVFVAFIALGRFFADGWTHRYGPAAVARALIAVALGGAAIVVLAPSLYLALVGFALMGIGICTSFPASTSAAARLGDRPSSENVAALTMSVQTVMLAAPPLMGFVADAFGIRATFAMVLPLLVLALALARALEPRPAR
jgi:predicted MFS family arabinose efflux permease